MHASLSSLSLTALRANLGPWKPTPKHPMPDWHTLEKAHLWKHHRYLATRQALQQPTLTFNQLHVGDPSTLAAVSYPQRGLPHPRTLLCYRAVSPTGDILPAPPEVAGHRYAAQVIHLPLASTVLPAACCTSLEEGVPTFFFGPPTALDAILPRLRHSREDYRWYTIHNYQRPSIPQLHSRYSYRDVEMHMCGAPGRILGQVSFP